MVPTMHSFLLAVFELLEYVTLLAIMSSLLPSLGSCRSLGHGEKYDAQIFVCLEQIFILCAQEPFIFVHTLDLVG